MQCHLLFEQLSLAPDEFVTSPEDGCGPEAVVLVPVQVENDLLPPVFPVPPPPAAPPLQQGPLHAETVNTRGDPVPQPGQVQEGGEPVSDVD